MRTASIAAAHLAAAEPTPQNVLSVALPADSCAAELWRGVGRVEGGGGVMGLGRGGDDDGTVGIWNGRLSKGANRLGPKAASLRTLVTPRSPGCRSPATRFH